MILLALTVLLQPVLAEDQPVRMVATPEAGDVEWSVDGVAVGRSTPNAPLVVNLTAGEHWVQATSHAQEAWVAMVRPDPVPGAGAALVPSWHATAQPSPAQQGSGRSLALPIALAGVGAALLVAGHWPRRPR